MRPIKSIKVLSRNRLICTTPPPPSTMIFASRRPSHGRTWYHPYRRAVVCSLASARRYYLLELYYCLLTMNITSCRFKIRSIFIIHNIIIIIYLCYDALGTGNNIICIIQIICDHDNSYKRSPILFLLLLARVTDYTGYLMIIISRKF